MAVFDFVPRKRFKRYERALKHVLYGENVLGGTKSVCKGIWFRLKRLFGTKYLKRITENKPRGRKSRIFPVSKNARFTHDMANFGFVVRGKRFSTHEAADPALAHEQAMPYEKCPSQM